jgi:predicted TPR repeat methyltransferase
MTSVRELYAGVAPQYDEVAAASRYLGPAWLADQLASVRHVVRAVDFGCATGALGRIIRERFPASYLIGIDLAEPMIDRARQLAVYDEVLVHDLNRPTPWIASASLDLVAALGFSEFLDDPAPLVGEAARILVPGGVFFMSFQHHRPDAPDLAPRTTSGGGVIHRAYTFDEIREMVRAADLELLELEAVTGYVSRSGFAHPYVMLRATRRA